MKNVSVNETHRIQEGSNHRHRQFLVHFHSNTFTAT